ncbi:NAD-binding protein, partial [Staphylococcus auricularis]|uniref:NAD-binding protein n=1 Tax=Staphylococcus auricularis TaxID=29379 RepID=UPI00177E3DF6
MKVGKEMMVNRNMGGLCEGVILGKKFDMEVKEMFEAIREGLGGCGGMEAKLGKLMV